MVEGKWLPEKEAKKLREAALEAEYSAKGYKKIDDVWVPPEEVDDARKGIFYYEGEKVSRLEMQAMQAGMVRHPRTGQLMNAEFQDKADSGYFPIGDGKWGDLKQANKYHSALSRPWMIRSEYATLISTMPLEKLEELKSFADQGHEKVAPLFGGRVLTPGKRPVVIIAKTNSEYLEYGNGLGDGTDATGAFLITDEAEFTMVGQGLVRPAICNNLKDWGKLYLRHAAALAYVNGIAEEAGADLPLWFVHGVGSMTSRFQNDSDAGWLGKQHVAKGGVGNIKSWLSNFELSADIDPPTLGFNLFQAGLLLSYATVGGDQEATNLMVAITDALSGKGKGSASKAITALEKHLAGKKPQIVEHLNKLIEKAPK